MKECCSVALDKATGVCPVSIGEIIHHFLSKCVMLLTETTETRTYINLNLSVSLGSVIEVSNLFMQPWQIIEGPNSH